MKSVIKMLYGGEIYPAERICPKSADFHKANIRISDVMEELKKRLPADDITLLDELHDLELEIGDLGNYAAFEYGLCFGICLIYEVLARADEILHKGEADT